MTAKLSKLFYERLGEQIANELVDWFNSVDATYKADLKEINELNWARFKAEMDAGIKGLKSELLAWMFGFWVTTLLALLALR